MHQLKFALGKEDKEEKSSFRFGNSMKHYNKSKSESMWALDPDVTGGGLEQNEEDRQFTKVGDALNSMLRISFNKDKIFSQIIFYDIVENIQVLLGEDMDEVECLLLIEKKMKEIVDNSKEENKNFNVSFYEQLIKRIKKLKKKQKKQELNQYDRIIHTNFKKKGNVQYINEDANNRKEYLETKENKLSKNMKSSITLNSNEGSSSKKSNSSNQGKLKGLLSQDKFSKVDESDKKDKQNDSVIEANESVSFSAVISQSMAVRSRSPRVNINAKKEKPKQEKIAHSKDDDKDEGQKDQAFIFYRPKKGKKAGF